MTEKKSDQYLALTTEIVTAYVQYNHVTATDLPGLIKTTYQVLAGLVQVASPATEGASAVQQQPPVPIGRSVQHNFIVCLEDGKKFKSLKRHLRTAYGLSPEEYRKKWGLRPDYPMVAPGYSAKRSALAKSIGLGSLRTSRGRSARLTSAVEISSETPPRSGPRRTRRATQGGAAGASNTE